MQKSEDLRVRRTRKLLQKALIELTIEKGFVDVTVRDISERAMVNRSTFYRHYPDKYALLSQYIEEVITLLYAQEDYTSPVDNPDQPSAGLVRILKHVQMNADFYRVILGKKGDPTFCAQRFRQFIEQQFRHMLPGEEAHLRADAQLNHVQTDLGKPPIDMSVSYMLHAGIGAIVWWLENDQPCTPEQIAVWLHQLSRANINVSLGLYPTKSYPPPG